MARQNCINETPPKWIAPTLTSGWADAAGYQGVRYRKWASDYVEVIGEIKAPAGVTGGSAGVLIFSMPATYAPLNARVFRQVADNGTGSFAVAHLEIQTSGQIFLYWSIANINKCSTEAAYFAQQ